MQAFETTAADSARAGATTTAPGPTASRSKPSTPKRTAERFIAERARHALQRLAPREPAAARWLERRWWRRRWIVIAALVALRARRRWPTAIGGSQRINLLAPPLWGVLAWNVVVYLVLAARALGALLRARPLGARAAGARAAHGARGSRRLRARIEAGGSATPHCGRSRRSGLRSARPLADAARAAVLLHAGAAALALGLIAGMYLRGLVLDYRVGWESTFLVAEAVHALLATVLAPAAALSGIALPDAAAFAALRVEPGERPPARRRRRGSTCSR